MNKIIKVIHNKSLFFLLLLLLNFTTSNSTLFANYSLESENNNREPYTSNNQSNSYSINGTDSYPTIAFVRPDFTGTAYFNSFYLFYANDTLNPNLYLNKSVLQRWGPSGGAIPFINIINTSYIPSDKIKIISDIDVHNNKLYDDSGNKLYSTLVFFQSEYVTYQEYINVVNFLSVGGNVICLNGDSFYAEITYDNLTNTMSLLNGHEYEFDGQTVENSFVQRFNSIMMDNLNFKYLGSRDCAFLKGNTYGAHFSVNTMNPHPIAQNMVNNGFDDMALDYGSHEENCVITRNVAIIADWKTPFTQENRGIKIYEFLPFGPFGGSLIHFGFFGTDILSGDKASVLTFVSAIKYLAGFYANPWIRYPVDNGVYSGSGITIDFNNNWETKLYLNNTFYPNFKPKTFIDGLKEGTYNLTILFKFDNSTIVRTVFFTIDNTPPKITFSLTNNSFFTNDTFIPIRIEVNDQNPEMFGIYSTTGNQTNGDYSIINNYEILRATETNKIKPKVFQNIFKDGTTTIYVESIDSAGNYNKASVSFSKNINGTILPVLQKVRLDKIDISMIRASIKPLNQNYTAEITIKRASSLVWESYKLDHYNSTTNEFYALINRSKEDYFIYKIYFQNQMNKLYVPFLSSFYWDSSILKISLNLIPNSINTTYNASIKVFNTLLVNNSIKISFIANNPYKNVYLGSYNGISNNFSLNYDFQVTNHGYYCFVFTYKNKSLLNTSLCLAYNNFDSIFKQDSKTYIIESATKLTSKGSLNYTLLSNSSVINFNNSLFYSSDYFSDKLITIVINNASTKTFVIIEFNQQLNTYYYSNYLFINNGTGSIPEGVYSNPASSFIDNQIDFLNTTFTSIMVVFSIISVIGLAIFLRNRKIKI